MAVLLNKAMAIFLYGVFCNTNNDEDQMDLLTSYFVDDVESFNLTDVIKKINYLDSYLTCLKKGTYTSSSKTIEFLNKKLEEYADVDKRCIKIVTNFVPDDKERNKIRRNVEMMAMDDDTKSIEIIFGDDLLQTVEQNTAPFNCVESGELLLDKTNNILRYDEKSFVCNISAKSLKDIWKKEGKRGLLALNLRYYIKTDSVDEKIESSIVERPENFWYLNNGIIIVCDDFRIQGNVLKLKKFSIVNGGQTTRMIGEVYFEKDFYLVCKVVKSKYKDTDKNNQFIADVAEASNTQKPIKAKDIIANRIEQRNLKTLLSANGIFIEIKRGEKCNTKEYPYKRNRTKNNELAQELYSFVHLKPGAARNNVSKILQQKDKYDVIFAKHSYDVKFYRDLIWLNQAFLDYSKTINKDDYCDKQFKGLVKNGKFFTLGLIGYILKNIYNKQYYQCCIKYKNNDGMHDIYFNEQSFKHGFIKEDTYKEFKVNSFQLFKYIIDSFIKPTFQFSFEASPSLSYSNFTKTDANFNRVIDYASRGTNNFNNDVFNEVQKYFILINESQELENENLYSENTNKALNEKNKGASNSVNEKSYNELYLDLFNFRTEKAKELKILESKFLTDKQLDKIAKTMPKNLLELKKICKNDYITHYSAQILELIFKHCN